MLLSQAIHAFHVWRRYRACARELSRLSDIELADIGVTRSSIPSVAWRVSRGNSPHSDARAADDERRA
jgi:uncharacterized protein YjiS (DUF1127 family)